jgi:hypothetical protein
LYHSLQNFWGRRKTFSLRKFSKNQKSLNQKSLRKLKFAATGKLKIRIFINYQLNPPGFSSRLKLTMVYLKRKGTYSAG